MITIILELWKFFEMIGSSDWMLGKDWPRHRKFITGFLGNLPLTFAEQLVMASRLI